MKTDVYKLAETLSKMPKPSECLTEIRSFVIWDNEFPVSVKTIEVVANHECDSWEIEL